MPNSLLRSKKVAGIVAVIGFALMCLVASISVYILNVSMFGPEGTFSFEHTFVIPAAVCAIVVEFLMAWYLVIFGLHGNPFKKSQFVRVVSASFGTALYAALRFMDISNRAKMHIVSSSHAIVMIDLLFLVSLSVFLMACAWITSYARELKEDSDSIW